MSGGDARSAPFGYSRLARALQAAAWLAGLVSALATGAGAYFLDGVDGVRPAGMGEAFTSVADDTNALLFNPAGLAHIKNIEINGMYSDLYSGLDTRLYNGQFDHSGYNYLAVAVPFDPSIGTLGVGWAQFNTLLYKENTFLLSFGRCLWSPYTLDLGIEVNAGITVKGLQWMVDAGPYTTAPYYPSADRQKLAYTADAGVLATVYDGVQVGFSVENIVPADVGLTVEEYVPAVFRLGGSYQLRWKAGPLDSLLSAAEVTARAHVYTPKAGVESWWLGERIGLRAGVNTDSLTAGLSVRESLPRSPLCLQIDYAFAYPWYLAGTLGSHRVGLLLRWDLDEPSASLPGGQPVRPPGTFVRDEGLIQNLRLGTALAQGVRDSAQTAVDSAREASRLARETAAQASREAADQVAAEEGKTARLARKVEAAAAQADELVKIMTQARTAAGSEGILTQLQAIAQSAGLDVAEIQKSLAAAHTQRYAVPEKDWNRIVIGVQTEIRSDFGTREQLEPLLGVLKAYLASATNMNVEFREYNLDNLKNDFIHGYVDLLASYSPFFQIYAEHETIRPVLTLQSRGKTTQACCLYVAKDQAFSQPEDLRDRRLGYIHSEILQHLKAYFYLQDSGYTNIHYFKNTFKFKSGVDAMGALQMKGVDAIAAFEYMETIAGNLKTEYPIGIKAIARSKPIPNHYLYSRPSKSQAKQKQVGQLTEALLRFHEDPAAKPVLDYFGIEQFLAAP